MRPAHMDRSPRGIARGFHRGDRRSHAALRIEGTREGHDATRIDALDEALAADDAREAIAKRIAATVPGIPDISNTHLPLSKEMEL